MAKITKKEMFAMVREIVVANGGENTEMLIDFIDHEVDLLTRKNTGEKKPTANQIANEAIKAEILAEMDFGKLYTCSDIVKNVAVCEGFTIQKVSPLMNQLADAGKVVKTTEKRKTYFSLA
jgi:hypothetical protein